MPTPIKATISGSSSGTVLGLNKYQTTFEQWQIWMEQIEPGFNSLQGYVMPDPFEGNASTRFGHAFESACIALTEEKIGFPITDQERVFSTIDNEGTKHLPPLSCHVDGMICDVENNILYEGKTTTQQAYRNGWDEEKNIIPRSYLLQVHHNMYLSGASEAIVSVLIFPESPDKWEEMGWRTIELEGCEYGIQKLRKNNGGDFIEPEEGKLYICDGFAKPIEWATALSQMGFHKIYRIPRNDELIDTMLAKYSEWWEKYIIGRTAPEPMNIDDIKRLCPQVSGTIVIEDETLIDAMAEYKEIGAEIGKGGNMSKRRDQLKVMILDAARKMDAVVDDESTDKWIFRDSRGHKIGSYYKTKAGAWTFRA